MPHRPLRPRTRRAAMTVRTVAAVLVLALPLAACGHLQVAGYGTEYNQGGGS